MIGKIAGVLMICGSLLLATYLAANKPKLDPEATRLIDSIDGRELYKAYCTVCHGSKGRGDGPMAKSLKIRPSDLTRIAARNGGKFPLARVQAIISSEQPVQAEHGTREMPVWGPVFSQFEWDQDLGKIRVYNLAKYIEEMQVR